MVLESLTNPFKAAHHPLHIFTLGAVYSSAGLFLGNWIFREYASLIMVFLTVMACIPLLYNTFKEEEKWELTVNEERKILKHHSKILFFLLFLFMGMVCAFVLWYVVLPSSMVQNSFSSQTSTIQSISTRLTGNYSSVNMFTVILLNNLKVLVFCILFSFIYGAGAIFILTWNASVIATAIGNYIRTNLASYTAHLGLAKYAVYFKIVSIGILKYFIHGIPEISAYFIGGIAGGIISVALIRENFTTKSFEKIVLDTSNLIIIAVIVLIIAALIEVYLTPVLF